MNVTERLMRLASRIEKKAFSPKTPLFTEEYYGTVFVWVEYKKDSLTYGRDPREKEVEAIAKQHGGELYQRGEASKMRDSAWYNLPNQQKASAFGAAVKKLIPDAVFDIEPDKEDRIVSVTFTGAEAYQNIRAVGEAFKAKGLGAGSSHEGDSDMDFRVKSGDISAFKSAIYKLKHRGVTVAVYD